MDISANVVNFFQFEVERAWRKGVRADRNRKMDRRAQESFYRVFIKSTEEDVGGDGHFSAQGGV